MSVLLNSTKSLVPSFIESGNDKEKMTSLTHFILVTSNKLGLNKNGIKLINYRKTNYLLYNRYRI